MLKALRQALGLRRATASTQETSIKHAAAPAAAAVLDYFRLGNTAVQNENYEEAVGHYAKSLIQQPGKASGYIGLGYAQLQLGRFAESIAALNNAVELDPQSGDAYFILGQAHLGMGTKQQAMQAWSRAHILAPELEHLYCDYCLLLFSQGQPDQARALMETGVRLFPGNADFKFYLANLRAESADYAGALSLYREAIALNPDSPHLQSSYATALMQIGDRDMAAAVLRTAMALAPDDAAIHSNYVLCIQYGTALSKEEKFQAAVAFSERFESPLQSEWGNYRDDVAPRKLRLGYVSGDFRNHSLANFIEPILSHHDKSRFELYCYYSHPVADEISRRIANLADHWIPCHGMADAELARRIRADGIDILVDLSGHTGYNRLLTFARKPAPVQMTWLGYQATTGLRAMDYRITDEALDPAGSSERFHSENLLRLPASGTFSPSRDSPPVNQLPVLSGRPFTFGCLNNPTKITDEAIAVWADILSRSPKARLMLGNATQPLVERLSAQFMQHGVESDRLIFQPKLVIGEYLRLHHEIDLALDSFPYNGGTTSFHSLWMGVPLITLEGDTALSKVGAGLMRGLGLSQFCAETKERYAARAVHFYEHPQELEGVRSSLREKFSVVMGQLAIEVTASLEAGMESCWKDYRNRAAAAPIQSRAP